jgi:hypothetical protein
VIAFSKILRTAVSAPFAYAGFGIKLSDDSGAGKKRLTGFPCLLRGRPQAAA